MSRNTCIKECYKCLECVFDFVLISFLLITRKLHGGSAVQGILSSYLEKSYCTSEKWRILEKSKNRGLLSSRFARLKFFTESAAFTV